eukprot:scaffold22064_cov62-Phaeocystis_antarctica.AAC.3
MVRHRHTVEAVHPVEERVDVEFVHPVERHPVLGRVVEVPPQRRAGVEHEVVVAEQPPRLVEDGIREPLIDHLGVLAIRWLREAVLVLGPRPARRHRKRRVRPQRHALDAAPHSDQVNAILGVEEWDNVLLQARQRPGVRVEEDEQIVLGSISVARPLGQMVQLDAMVARGVRVENTTFDERRLCCSEIFTRHHIRRGVARGGNPLVDRFVLQEAVSARVEAEGNVDVTLDHFPLFAHPVGVANMYRDDTHVPLAAAKAVAKRLKIDVLSGHKADQLVVSYVVVGRILGVEQRLLAVMTVRAAIWNPETCAVFHLFVANHLQPLLACRLLDRQMAFVFSSRTSALCALSSKRGAVLENPVLSEEGYVFRGQHEVVPIGAPRSCPDAEGHADQRQQHAWPRRATKSRSQNVPN